MFNFCEIIRVVSEEGVFSGISLKPFSIVTSKQDSSFGYSDRIFSFWRTLEICRIIIYSWIRLGEEVLVTRRGQTTIPAKIRKKLNIREGTRLKVEIDGEKVVFSKIRSVFDLAGTSTLSQKRVLELLDKMREEG